MFKLIIYEMTRGYAYRQIRHPYTWVYTWLIPVIFVAVAIAFYYLQPARPALLGERGLFASALSVVSTLPGFYFAGLAAVATFANDKMDRLMPHPTPTAPMRIGSVVQQEPLSRRQFLTLLFSYMVVASFALCIILLGVNASAPSLIILKAYVAHLPFGAFGWDAAVFLGITFISFLAGSLASSTLHGVYFLAERLHQP